MNAFDLAAVGPGFSDPVMESQAVFRRSLEALSHPGRIVDLADSLDPVPGVAPAAGALLLSLLDADTRLWLSDSLASGTVPATLKFHTGCHLAAAPEEADFGLVAAPGELPDLARFSSGSDEFPERGATLVLQVPALEASGADSWRLSGPGIRDTASLFVPSLGWSFLQQWSANTAGFPRGVDLFLASGSLLCGLPRTTKIKG